MSLRKKVFLTSSMCLGFMFFGMFPVHAASQGLDQRCFTREDCDEARKSLNTNALPGEGFVVNAESTEKCGAQIYGRNGLKGDAGFCLPITEAETKIGIGGRNRFTDVATFFAYLYRYAMIVAVAISIILIVVAGIQWMVSAGSTQAISSAKKRIANALSGLIILATSFVILSTINPELTKLRLPKVWMIRGVDLADPWCRNLSQDLTRYVPVVLARERGNQAFSEYDESKFDTDSVWNFEAECGNDYYIAGAQGQTCRGHRCQEDYTCTTKRGNAQPECVEGNIVGNIYTTSLVETAFAGTGSGGWIARHALAFLPGNYDEGWTWKWLSDVDKKEPDKTTPGNAEDDLHVYAVCTNGSGQVTKIEEVDDIIANRDVTDNDEDKSQFFSYSFKGISYWEDARIDNCGSNINNFAGYVLGMEFNEFADPVDETHFIGNNKGDGIDLGDDNATHAKCVLSLPASKQFLLQQNDIMQGVSLEIDMSNISDIDDSTGRRDRNAAYRSLGYTYEACQPAAPISHPTGGISGCFLAGTKVETNQGPMNIEDLSSDLKLLSKNTITNEYSYQPFRQILTFEVDGYYSLNNGLLKVTGSHPIFVRSKDGTIDWGNIDAMTHNPATEKSEPLARIPLSLGDEVQNSDGDWITVDAIEYIQKNTTVYNIEYVDKNHTFFADSILVHNVVYK